MSSESCPPARSLNRQKILEEDEYTEALSEIIARDFFPSLVHLDATNSYLDALRSQDPERINDTVRRLQDLATPTTSKRPLTPGYTPYGAGPTDTPTPYKEDRPKKRVRYDTSLSLDAFQARYTSEDNASFTEILNEENKKRKERWAWAWEAQKRANQVKAIESDTRSRLLIEDAIAHGEGVHERARIEMPQVKLITSGGEENQAAEAPADDSSSDENPEKTMPSATSLVKVNKTEPTQDDVLAPRKDKRPAGVAGWSFKARNSLMFTPDADRSPFDGPTSLPSTAQQKGPQKTINYKNTRLPEQSNEDGDTATTAPNSPTRSRIEAAISGTPYVPHNEREGYPLLPPVPTPTPSQFGSAAVNKLMTWGTITATPKIISSDGDEPMDEPATPFRLAGPTPRERVAHKLSSSASRSLRAKLTLSSGTPLSRDTQREGGGFVVPNTPRPHAGMLTPAARRLLDRTKGLGTSTSRRADVMRRETNGEGGKSENMRNVRWTPSPMGKERRVM